MLMYTTPYDPGKEIWKENFICFAQIDVEILIFYRKMGS